MRSFIKPSDVCLQHNRPLMPQQSGFWLGSSGHGSIVGWDHGAGPGTMGLVLGWGHGGRSSRTWRVMGSGLVRAKPLQLFLDVGKVSLAEEFFSCWTM